MNQHTVPNMTGLLSDAIRQVAMVADVSTSAIGLTRTDKQASAKADKDHAAKAGAGKVVVYRFAGADDKIRAIMDLQNAAIENLKRKSMVWGLTKRRLLPNANFQSWIGEHTRIKDSFDKAVEALVADADNIIQQAQQNLGSYKVDLPSKSDMEKAFTLSYALEPIPDPKQFGDIMGDELSQGIDQHLQYQFEQNIQAAYNNAVQDTAQRMTKPLENLADRMDAYEKRERDIQNGIKPGKEGYFRDTIIENVQEIAQVLSTMNAGNDPAIDAINKKLAGLMKVTPDILRQRGDVRRAVSARAREVLKDLDGILVR